MYFLQAFFHKKKKGSNKIEKKTGPKCIAKEVEYNQVPYYMT